MKIRDRRAMATVALAVVGIVAMVYYSVCETDCSYLKGDIFGIDLKYVGSAYMLAIIVLALSGQTALVRILLAWGIGVEVHLVAFQVGNDVFCQFCLAFGAAVLLAFIVNYEKPRPAAGWFGRIVAALGEAELPLPGHRRIPLLPVAILGYLFVVLTFSGSATPVYGGTYPWGPSAAVLLAGRGFSPRPGAHPALPAVQAGGRGKN
ncbi:MAG: hypothetical protein ACYC7J_19460 [Syntrophales bacterium]